MCVHMYAFVALAQKVTGQINLGGYYLVSFLLTTTKLFYSFVS